MSIYQIRNADPITSPWTCNPIGLQTVHLALVVSGEVQVQVQFITHWDLPIAKFQLTTKIIFIRKIIVDSN